MILWNSQLIFHNLKKSFYLLSWKSLSCIKFLNWKIFPNGIQIFFKHPFHFKWKKSCHLLSRVLYLKRIWIHEDQKTNMKVLGKSFYSLSFNFQKVLNSLTFRQSIKQQSNNQSIYLFFLTERKERKRKIKQYII